jgi:hypothetical protein
MHLGLMHPDTLHRPHILRALILLVVVGCPAFASLLVYSNEAEAKAAVENLDKESFKPQMLAEAMARGWWSAADDMIELAQRHGVAIDAQVDYQSRVIQQQLVSLKKKVRRQSSNLKPSISPAVQWTQSVNNVHMLVKFSHKIDAPATMGVKEENVLLEANSFSFNASNSDKKFHLSLDLFAEIVPEDSTYTCGEGHGRCTFVLRKKSNVSKWPRLMQDSSKKLRNMHIWWAMQEQIEDTEEKNDAKKRELRADSEKAKTDKRAGNKEGEGSKRKKEKKNKNGSGAKKKKTKKGWGLGKLDEDSFVAVVLNSAGSSPLAMGGLGIALAVQLVGLYNVAVPLLAPILSAGGERGRKLGSGEKGE